MHHDVGSHLVRLEPRAHTVEARGMISQTIASMTGSAARRIIEDDDVKPTMTAIVAI